MTATQLRELVKGVVEAHDTHNTFYSIWSDVKDRETELTYPCAIWDQWRARLTEDEFGQLHRAVLVRLLVITAVATDRTPAQRDAAVEAADIAAADFILKIRQDYPDLTVTNVSTTTQFDEYTQLETGVLLTFTVEGEGLCLDADHFEPGAGDCDPATVTNSDSSYTQEVAAGATLNLPDVTHTDSDGSPVTLPGMVAFVATPCAPGDDAHVLINQKPVIDLGPGETWDLHVEYPDGTPVGSWNAGAERWEIPECPACDPATAVLKNTDGTILDTEEIPSGGSEDIIAPDATAVLKNSEGTTLDTELIPSGVSEDVIAPDATVQLKDSAGTNIGTPVAVPSGVSQKITAPDGTIKTTDGVTTVGAVLSGASANLPQSVIKYKDAANADQVTSASDTEFASGTLRPATQIPRRELTRDGVGTGSYVTASDLIAGTVPDVTTERAIVASWAAGDDETIPIILPAEYQGQTFDYVSNTGTNGTITVSVDGASSYAAPPFTVGTLGVSFKRTTYAAAGSVLYEV